MPTIEKKYQATLNCQEASHEELEGGNLEEEDDLKEENDLEEGEDREEGEDLEVDRSLGKDTVCEEEQDDQNNGAKELFEKMLALRIDRHALAIKDGYRIKPQVCVCGDECCSCFDYSPFLHNLKLHTYKKLLASEYNKMSEARKQHAAGEDALSASGSGCTLDRTSISGLFQSKFAKTGAKRDDPDPPYESRFNSTHGRLRAFDPNLYKFHVREEARKYSDKRPGRSDNQTREPAMRPTWRI
ncbi:unnamed protein product [Nesidiocoris tenuis]|uniref:Uncharacterized protein n=1 Tax=Nesidiocoris tenuis TaxID=355587 RepID=A0A6H5GBU3_9HEMI|nr:unnamed protein product [Nesidiocoris tenuis]